MYVIRREVVSDELPLRRLWEKFVGDVALAERLQKVDVLYFVLPHRVFPHSSWKCAPRQMASHVPQPRAPMFCPLTLEARKKVCPKPWLAALRRVWVHLPISSIAAKAAPHQVKLVSRV